MKTWERNWIRIVSWLVSYVAVIAVFFLVMVLGAWLFRATTPVRAEMLTVPQCEPIAQAGGILIYRCQLEYGPPVFVNTIGFMMVEE